MKVSEVKAKRLPELDDDFATEAAGLDTIAELREDIATRLLEHERHDRARVRGGDRRCGCRRGADRRCRTR